MNNQNAARVCGALTVVAAAAVIIGVFARVAADADGHETLRQSLQAIADNSAAYSIYGALTMLSGASMIGAAWFLRSASAFRPLTALPVVPVIFGVAGAIYILSGAAAIFLATLAPDMSQASGMTSEFRRISATVAFIVSGIGLIASGFYQWKAGAPLRYIAPFSVLIGVFMQGLFMQLLTSEGIAIIDRGAGLAFVAWLFIVGLTLASVPSDRLVASLPAREGGRA